VCFQSSFESDQGARIVDRSKLFVPGRQCRDSKRMLFEVRRGIRPLQGCSGVQCPRWLMSVQLTCKVSWCTRVDGSKRNCPELEVDMLVDRQPVQLLTNLTVGTLDLWLRDRGFNFQLFTLQVTLVLQPWVLIVS